MRKATPPRPRLMLTLDREMIRALKVRAAEQGTTVSKLVAAWVASWAAGAAPRKGGRR